MTINSEFRIKIAASCCFKLVYLPFGSLCVFRFVRTFVFSNNKNKVNIAFVCLSVYVSSGVFDLLCITLNIRGSLLTLNYQQNRMSLHFQIDSYSDIEDISDT